jgi:hypothetical protein
MAQKVTFSHLIAYPKYISTKQPGSKQQANSQPASQPARQAARQDTQRQGVRRHVCVYTSTSGWWRAQDGGQSREQSRAEQRIRSTHRQRVVEVKPALDHSHPALRVAAGVATHRPLFGMCVSPSTRQRKASYSRMRVSQTTCVSRSSVCWRSN